MPLSGVLSSEFQPFFQGQATKPQKIKLQRDEIVEEFFLVNNPWKVYAASNSKLYQYCIMCGKERFETKIFYEKTARSLIQLGETKYHCYEDPCFSRSLPPDYFLEIQSEEFSALGIKNDRQTFITTYIPEEEVNAKRS